MRAFLLLMICSLMSVQGIRQRGKSSMSRRYHSMNVTEAEFAACMPTYKVICLKNQRKDKDSNVEYYPPCTRVKRCSGVCLNRYNTCQPNETEQRNFFVPVLKDGSNGGRISESRTMRILEHKSCKCSCVVKKCGENQEFDEELCRCVCMNFDEQRNCRGDKNKSWTDENCRCE